MNSRFTQETTEAQRDEMTFPGLQGSCSCSGFKTAKSGSSGLPETRPTLPTPMGYCFSKKLTSVGNSPRLWP